MSQYTHFECLDCGNLKVNYGSQVYYVLRSKIPANVHDVCEFKNEPCVECHCKHFKIIKVERVV